MPDLEQNKNTVRAFYELAFNQKKPEEAVARYGSRRDAQPDARPRPRIGAPRRRTSSGSRMTRWSSIGTCSSRCPRRRRTTTRCSDREAADDQRYAGSTCSASCSTWWSRGISGKTIRMSIASAYAAISSAIFAAGPWWNLRDRVQAVVLAYQTGLVEAVSIPDG